MKFTLKQMRYAEAAGRLGSIAAAAAELNISQSSISAAIDALEQELGFDLFVRQPSRGVAPTPAGREALAILREMLGAASHLQSELECLGGAARGVLRLGCYVTAAPHVLPPLLRAFAARFPQARIDLREGDMDQMRELLAAGEIDLALTYAPGSPGEEAADAFEPLLETRPYAVVPASDPLAARPAVTLAALAERPFILLDLPHASPYYLGLFEAAGLRPRIAHSTRSSEIVRALVGAEFGVSVLNIRSARDEEGLACLPIDADIPAARLGVAMIPGVRRPVMSREFLALCRDLRAAGAFASLAMPAAGGGGAGAARIPGKM